MKGNYLLDITVRNRHCLARNGRAYGGIGIVTRRSRTSFKEFNITNPENFEIVAVVEKVHGVKGTMVCIGCYLPPNITRACTEKNVEFLSDLVTEAKRKFEGCSTLVAGNFNQWKPDGMLNEHPNMTENQHGVTRGDKAIDRTFVNFGRSIEAFGVLKSLDSEEGSKSDHGIAWANAIFEKPPNKDITYSYLHYTQRGVSTFLEELEQQG